MNSTWLLFKAMRRRLLICGVLCLLVPLSLAGIPEISSPQEKALAIWGFSLGLAILMGSLGQFHTVLFRPPFPVTHRQLAWIPSCCMGVLWTIAFMSAVTGICLNGLFFGGAPLDLPGLFYATLELFPAAFLVFATADRMARYFGLGAMALSSLLVPVMLDYSSGPGPFDPLAIYQYLWPCCLAMGAFFILEAPIHITAMEYPQTLRQGLINLELRTPGAAAREPLTKLCADVLTLLALVPSLYLYFLLMMQGSTVRYLFDFNQNSIPKILWLSFIGATLLALLRYAWRSSRANGFGTAKTLVTFLMQCSLVLVPLTWAMGAKRGMPVTCERCRKSVFVWASRCPHCGHPNGGNVKRSRWAALLIGRQSMPQERPVMNSRLLYRSLMLVYLTLFGLFTVNTSFMNDRFHLKLNGWDSGTSETILAEFKAQLATVNDARARLEASEETPLQLPERFRIEFAESPGGVEVLCYWLRWENVGPLGEQIQSRIIETFPDTLLVPIHGVDRTEDSYPILTRPALFWFLDGRIHWVEE